MRMLDARWVVLLAAGLGGALMTAGCRAGAVPASPAAAALKPPSRSLETAFTPLQKIKPEVLEAVSDDAQSPEVANDLKAEAEFKAIVHLYRFLRSHTPVELAAMAEAQASHADLLRNSEHYRGKVVRLRVQTRGKPTAFAWPENEAGVRETSMVLCRGADPKGGAGEYAILVARPVDSVEDAALYDVTGVFLKRYPTLSKDNVWKWQPLLLALDISPAAPPQ
jgi:hypothetical protein